MFWVQSRFRSGFSLGLGLEFRLELGSVKSQALLGLMFLESVDEW